MCACTYTSVCVRVCMYVYIFILVYMYVFICTSVYARAYLYVYIYTCVYERVHVYVCVYTCVKLKMGKIRIEGKRCFNLRESTNQIHHHEDEMHKKTRRGGRGIGRGGGLRGRSVCALRCQNECTL